MHTNKYLTNLTPLRGIAALLTVVYHVDIILSIFFGGGLVNSKKTFFMSHLYVMVDFFFILSGFILCYVYAQNFKNSVDGNSFKKFTIARFARVYPLHLFSLLLTAFFLFLLRQWRVEVSPAIDSENSFYSFITNLFLLQSMNLHKWFTFTHASWSISTEWWMYMLFPFLVGPFMKLSKFGRLVIFALCIAGYLLIGYILVQLVTVPDALSFLRPTGPQPFNLNVAYQFGFFRCLFGFVIGMIIYFGYKENWAKQLFASDYTFLFLVLGVMLCLHFGVPDIFTVLLFPFILLSAAYGNNKMNAIFATKPLQRLGDWSFSIYLLHQPFLYQGAILFVNPDKTGITVPKLDIFTSWLICLIFIIFILFISYLSYRFIELPVRNLINKKWGRQKVHLTH